MCERGAVSDGKAPAVCSGGSWPSVCARLGEPEAVPAVRPSVQLRGCAGALLQVCEEKPSSEEVLC